MADTPAASQYAKLASTEFVSQMKSREIHQNLRNLKIFNFGQITFKEDMKSVSLFLISIVAVLAGCASPTVVQTVKPGDSGLACAQLQNEYSDAEKFKKDAEGEKGVTGGNTARLLFWPAIVGTYMNANEAISAADNRKVHLVNLMTQKNCQVPGMYTTQNK